MIPLDLDLQTNGRALFSALNSLSNVELNKLLPVEHGKLPKLAPLSKDETVPSSPVEQEIPLGNAPKSPAMIEKNSPLIRERRNSLENPLPKDFRTKMVIDPKKPETLDSARFASMPRKADGTVVRECQKGLTFPSYLLQRFLQTRGLSWRR
jgi:hypothetical protein